MRYLGGVMCAALLASGCGYVPDVDLPENIVPVPDGGSGSGNGGVLEGGACESSEACASNLVCAGDHTCREAGEPGTAGQGEPCGEPTACQINHACIEGICIVSMWSGIQCQPAASEQEPLKLYFELDGAFGEFYRLPFPNDIRRSSRGIDLTGHPNPGVIVEALGNPVDAYFEMLEEDLDGFGTQTAIYFRFNRYPLNETLVLDTADPKQSVFLINIDPDSDQYGQRASSYGFKSSSVGNNYICGNWLAVIPRDGRPLLPGTTYAAMLTSAITDANGVPAVSDSDFGAMLWDSLPDGVSDTVTEAWEAYQPLRDFLDDDDAVAPHNEVPAVKLSAETIVSAAVFTTSDPARRVRNLREAVRNEDEPEMEDLLEEEITDRYALFTGTVSTPFYQRGERPFLAPSDGGAIEYDRDGRPERVETEDVRFALTVPESMPSETGWPVIIYAHGTGGSEQSFIENGFAARMGTIGVAVLSMEQVQHGNRRAPMGSTPDSDTPSPDALFYNFLNPRAARDNNIQAAAELFQAVRFLEGFDAVAEGAGGMLDLDRVYFFGHSQGTQGAFLGAIFEPRIKGVVLSGAGGLLIESLLNKTNPADLRSMMRVFLMEDLPRVSASGETVDPLERAHPLLNLVQTAFESVDPVNYAQYVFQEDLSELGIVPRHVYMGSGVGDTYAPDATQFAMAKALRLKQWASNPEYLFDAGSIGVVESLPHQRTYSSYGVTAVLVRYAPEEGSDGHFVMFENPDAVRQTDAFIQTMFDEHAEPQLIQP